MGYVPGFPSRPPIPPQQDSPIEESTKERPGRMIRPKRGTAVSKSTTPLGTTQDETMKKNLGGII